jgi:siderophore synthetase component
MVIPSANRLWIGLALPNHNVVGGLAESGKVLQGPVEGHTVSVPSPEACPSRPAASDGIGEQLPTDLPHNDVRQRTQVRTGAEQAALAALRSAYPQLTESYEAALRQARAMGLAKLWIALSRERLGGITPSVRTGRPTLLLPNGSWLSAPPKITDAFAEHPSGLAVTLHGRGEQPHEGNGTQGPFWVSAGTLETSLIIINHPVTLLTAVMASRFARSGGDQWLRLSAELADSVANHALALVGESWRHERLVTRWTDLPTGGALRWAARRAAADPTFSPLALFEQAVVDGHPLHPCARIRGGMTTQELFSYAPEWADEVAVGVVAVAASSFTQSSCGREGITALLRRWHPAAANTAETYLRGARRDPASYELLPVHPWQLRRTVADRYANALADARILVIPHARVRARPLLSLRTLAPSMDRRAAHMKTAVDIRLTTALRIVSPATAHNGPVMSRLLAEICRREHGFGGRFVVLVEFASASYRPAPGEPADNAASLAAIVRESPECHTDDGEVALPAGALAARSPLTGQPLLADALDELAATHRLPLDDAAAHFLSRYCDCVLPALFALLSRWGIALEPHGQNAVVVLRGGLPVRLLYRDFGGIRVSQARLTHRSLRTPLLVGAVLAEDEDELRTKLFFPLIDTNLTQVVAALVHVGQSDPGRLWQLVAQRCRAVYATLCADPAIRPQAQRDEAALFGPTLLAKSMLRTQMSATPHAAQWVAVPNPLAATG